MYTSTFAQTQEAAAANAKLACHLYGKLTRFGGQLAESLGLTPDVLLQQCFSGDCRQATTAACSWHSSAPANSVERAVSASSFAPGGTVWQQIGQAYNRVAEMTAVVQAVGEMGSPFARQLEQLTYSYEACRYLCKSALAFQTAALAQCNSAFNLAQRAAALFVAREQSGRFWQSELNQCLTMLEQCLVGACHALELMQEEQRKLTVLETRLEPAEVHDQGPRMPAQSPACTDTSSADQDSSAIEDLGNW